MAIEQDLIQKNKETYRRKPLLYTALILFILSWFLPAAEGYLGLMIVIQALPFIWYPLAWPVSANMMFYTIYSRLDDNKAVSPWLPCLMLFMMIPASLGLAGGVLGWGYVIWVVSGILLFADWLGSRKPQKRRLIVRLAVVICLIWTVGLVGIGLSQKKYHHRFEEKPLSVFYNTLGFK